MNGDFATAKGNQAKRTKAEENLSERWLLQETVMPGYPSPLDDNAPDEGSPLHPSPIRWIDVAKTSVRFPDAISADAPDESGDRPAGDTKGPSAAFRRWHGRTRKPSRPI